MVLLFGNPTCLVVGIEPHPHLIPLPSCAVQAQSHAEPHGSMACVCFLPDCPQCHPVPDDAWRFDGKYVTRAHHRPRHRLFTPTGAGAVGIPVAVEKLLNHRTTKIVESGGSASISHVDEDMLMRIGRTAPSAASISYTCGSGSPFSRSMGGT